LLLEDSSADLFGLEILRGGGRQEVFFDIFVGFGKGEEDKGCELPVFVLKVI